MKGKTNKALLIALPLALAACGGGGGGGDNPAADNVKPQQLGKTADYVGALFTTPANNTSAPVVRPTSDSSNMVLHVTGSSESYTLPPTTAGATKQRNILIYGSATGKGGSFIAPDKRSYQSLQVSDNSYSYVQFGFANGTDSNLGGFYRGQPVGAMPTNGTATYRGDAIVATFKGEQFDKTELGTVRADADFAEKKLQFTLNSPNHNGSVEAAIEDNRFVGVNSKGSVGGVFYGPNAEEIAGSYSATGAFAVFGAKR